MTRVYFVRHGQTYFEADRRLKGQLDVALDPTGRKQARAVANHLCGTRIDAVYASSLWRAREGADMIAKLTQAPLLVCPLIDERGWGQWQGLTDCEMAVEQAAGRVAVDGFGPLGEPAGEFAGRAQLFLDLMAERSGQTIVAVTHGGILKNVILPAIGRSTTDRGAYAQDTGAISLLEHDGGAWRPAFLNLRPA